MKTYERLGLVDQQVINIQHFIAGVDLLLIEKQFSGVQRIYAHFLYGENIGEARIKESLGMKHVINPDEV